MSLSSQIKSKTGTGKVFKIDDEYDEVQFIYIHHLLMKEYGWIPLQELLSLPMPTLMNLLDTITQEKNAQAKELEKSNRRRR